jgi:complement component 1 Q subcomponent-binding protein, mitochondrial
MYLYRIKVAFSIADINGIDEDAAQLDDDTALDDEDMAMGDDMLSARSNQTINQPNKTGAVDVMPEDSTAPADGAAQGEDDGALEDDDQMPPAYPIRLNITIIKPSKGAVQVDALARDGLIEVQDVFYFPNADIAVPATPEKMHARQNVYAGPPFSNLDNELQSMLERYLDERGINPQLASFIPDYSDYKEQKEYVQWLGSKF